MKLNCCKKMINDQDDSDPKYHKPLIVWNKDIYGYWNWIILGACIELKFCPWCGKKIPIFEEYKYIYKEGKGWKKEG